MKNILQTINYQYPKPVNFDENDPSFEIFRNVADENCVEPKIEILKNVRISTNSVIFTYFKIFKESCITPENKAASRQKITKNIKKDLNFF
jgi:hypothetical protein